ncbi:MAG: flagellar hook-length control protein FliK [Lachnospiraceae bacterium]|nr:flagellar hook-length control protein FliK [Lachnospiraceae bacterium]
MINGIRLDEQRTNVYDDMRSQIREADTSQASRITESGQNAVKTPDVAENQAAAGGVNSAVQKALEEAGLPRNERNSGIVRQMLENQMSIDKDSLTRVVTQANMFREADISTLLLMNKNNMPVTHFTAAQLQAYINNEQDLSAQIGDVINSLMEYLSEDAASGTLTANTAVLEILTGTAEAAAEANTAATAEVTAAQVAAENIEALAGGQENVMNVLMTGQGGSEAIIAAAGQHASAVVQEEAVLNMLETSTVSNVINELGTDAEGSGANWMNGFGADDGELASDAFSEYNMDNSKSSMTGNTAKNANDALGQGVPLSQLLSENEISDLNSLQTRLFGKASELKADTDSAEVLKNIYNNINNLSEAELKELFQSEPYRKMIGKALGEKFTLNADDIDSADSINDYYKETFKMLSKLSEMAGKESTLADKLSKPMDNIKFMDTLNNVFPYIQLPLKLNEGETHGELYVFKKGRNKAEPGDSSSVLLHLDMDSLGSTDIHLELKAGFLKLRFYCADEAAKDILSDHFSELETALNNKSFQVTSEFNVRTVETQHIVEALSGEAGNMPEFKYNFDIRA